MDSNITTNQDNSPVRFVYNPNLPVTIVCQFITNYWQKS